ncbi:ubiquitin-like-conjugating enzyme ATG10 [Cloeon dipterum]|uniref:ubiquitin-like-conjugating enzyme ATG10 n=1 Tax=Cloeon dipterum TaxID=197152 RepID=UPI0032200B80
MQISWEKFLEDIGDLKTKSDVVNDGWQLEGNVSQTGLAYLSKSLVNNVPVSSLPGCLELEESDLEECMLDPSTKINPSLQERVTFEYHILYSLSYAVPILYFNAWRENGSLLEIERIWDLAFSQYRNAVKSAKWGAVSQQDHPILGSPFFFFHPCNTANFLEDLPGKTKNTVVSWLSVVGPLVGLTVPLFYAEAN